MIADSQIRTGKVEFHVPSIDTPCETFYKIFGNLETSSAPPLIVLHGGPGSGHEYCLPFSEIWQLHHIPVIFYDQIGCASSTHLRHTVGDETFWTLDLFIAELQNLLSHLGIVKPASAAQRGFDILGHSWGGVIATAFAATRPVGLRRLILAGAPASGQLWYEGLLELTKQMSDESQRAVDRAVETYDFTQPTYLAAMEEFGRTFLCRADPWPPEELAKDFQNQTEDGTVRQTLCGPSPWIYNGVLRKIDLVPLLPQINVPTLVLNGQFDTTQDHPTAPFFEHIPNVTWITIAGASHMSHLDSAALRAGTLKLVGDFLRGEGEHDRIEGKHRMVLHRVDGTGS